MMEAQRGQATSPRPHGQDLDRGSLAAGLSTNPLPSQPKPASIPSQCLDSQAKSFFQFPSPTSTKPTHLLSQEGDNLSTDPTETLHNLGLAGSNREEAWRSGCQSTTSTPGHNKPCKAWGEGSVSHRCKYGTQAESLAERLST